MILRTVVCIFGRIFSAAGFFEKGIEYLCQLVQNNKYTAAIRVVHDMSGILVRSVDYLIEHAP